jgi:P-type Cu2+ transporter
MAASSAALARAALCFHCGAQCPPRFPWVDTADGRERVFCCAGCLAVTQTIEGAGLDAYYRNRMTNAAPRAEGEDAAALRACAAAEAADGLVRTRGDGAREVALLIDGMTCGACVVLLERWIAKQPGVVDVRVNYATRRARLVYDAAKTTLATIAGATTAIGYRAYPYDPARRETLARRDARSLFARTAIAWLAMMQVMMFAVPVYLADDGVAPEQRALLDWASLALTLPVMLYSAVPFFRGAWRDLRARRAGMDVPVALALGAAFATSAASTLFGGGAVYYDSVTMFVALLLTARYLELAARQRGADAIEALARAMPDVAERLRAWPACADTDTLPSAMLAPGDLVRVRPGATIPADGDIVDGRSLVEEAVLTGESRPRERRCGDAVLAGSVNRDGALIVRVRAAGDATRLAAVARMADAAASARPRVAALADRMAGAFVVGLLLLAAATAAVWLAIEPSRAPAVTFAVLVVSCPCAFSLATPAALTVAAGALARRGVVLARPDAIEALSRVTHVVLDKTGTLTDGHFRLLDVVPCAGVERERALGIAVALEAASEHPVARAICAAAPEGAPAPVATGVLAVPGSGVEGTIDGTRWRIGRPAFVAALSRTPIDDRDPPAWAGATIVALGNADGIVATLACADAPRGDAAAFVARLRAQGLVAILLSGDRAATVTAIGAALGLADARGDLSPHDKRAAIAALQDDGAIVAMMGDGINDAPALAQAHVSISLASAAPLAQWSADVVVLAPRLTVVADALAQAKRTLAVIRRNLRWALAYNAIAIPAAAFGFVTPLLAAVGMSLSSLVVVAGALVLSRWTSSSS